MWKAKEDVLWFKKGQIVDDIQDNWKPHFDEIVKVEPVKKEEPKPIKKAMVKKGKRGKR